MKGLQLRPGCVHSLIALLMCAALLGCARPKALVYQDVRSFRVHKADLQQVTIVLELQFYNPNNYGLSLKNGDLDAYFNEKYLGKATLEERTAIPARDTFLLPVTVTTDPGNLLANALELLTAQGKEVLVRLQGTVYAGKGGVFIGVPVRYEGGQRIHL